MASRFRSIFAWSTTDNNKVKGQSYEKTVASNPPVKGSYPVAGNGPNVLEELQRSRARRASLTTSTGGSTAPAPSIARHRESTIPRPRTAPHNGEPGGGQNAASRNRGGRTLSGFSMKSPPSFLKDFSARRQSISSSSRRNSIKTTTESPPPLPTSVNPPVHIPTYQPKTGNGTPALPNAPFAQKHLRNTSTATNSSHRSHVDLLDAHSNINRTREASKHRTKASGVRNYGEDVADRNITQFGEKNNRDSRLDLSSPEFSYLKQVYSPKKRHPARGSREPHSRVDSALGHVLGSDGSGDDTVVPQSRSNDSYPRPNSIRSSAGPRPGANGPYPPRTDSTNLYRSNRIFIRGDDEGSETSMRPNGVKERAMSPLSTASASTYDYPDYGASRTPPIPERGRARALSTNAAKTPPPPNPAPAPSSIDRISSPNQRRLSSGNTHLRKTHRTMSPESTSPSSPNGGTRSRKSSQSYSAFPPPVKGEDRNPDTNASAVRSPVQSAPSLASRNTTKRDGLVIEGASEAPNLDGIVDLKDSVDTDVFTKTLPAVVHEHVTPTRHEIREERITREIHTHDVYHRILPVIETEILPTRHYIPSKDNKSLIEIPESEVAKHTITGTIPNNWHIASGPPQAPNAAVDATNRSSSDSAPDGPVVGFTRNDAPSTRRRGNSVKSAQSTSEPSSRRRALSTKSTFSAKEAAKEMFQPILSSKRESVSKEGHPKTEYVWRHPPVFETVNGDTVPAIIPAAFEGEARTYYSEDDSGAEYGAEKAEADLLFRESGYGNAGMLPGLQQPSPANFEKSNLATVASTPRSMLGRVVDDGKAGSNAKGKKEGEATSYLRQMREKRQGFRTKYNGKNGNVEGLESGVRNMSVK